jgi:hypothetical protein
MGGQHARTSFFQQSPLSLTSARVRNCTSFFVAVQLWDLLRELFSCSGFPFSRHPLIEPSPLCAYGKDNPCFGLVIGKWRVVLLRWE